MPVAADFQGQKRHFLPNIADGADIRPPKAPLIMWHGNLDAIVASHQDTILGSPEVGDAHGQPYADRQ